MTNKLPVVGKRYRRLHCGNEYELISFCQSRNSYFLKAVTGIDKDAVFEFSNYFAGKYFEELPEDKAETKPETQSHISELSPEVKEAMGDFRNELAKIRRGERNTEIQITLSLAALMTHGEIIISALDKQFANNKIQVEKFVDNKIEEESIWKPARYYIGESCDVFIKGADENHENADWIQTGKFIKGMGFFTQAFQEIDGFKIIQMIGESRYVNVDSNNIKYCRIVDFINDYEKLKERVKRLESSRS